jgi:dTDP-4-amino-4,6-dideoxygalactose transaminase
MSVPDTLRHGSATVIFEEYPVPGFNYRMTDIQAAVGREQLKRLPGIVERRRQLAEGYRTMLAGIDGLAAPVEPEWARSNWQSYCVSLHPDIDQLGVMQKMLDNGVATRRGIMCIHMEHAYADLQQRHPLQRSEAARDHAILLPLFPQMTDDEQAHVVDALTRAVLQNRTTLPRRRA